MAIGVKLFDNSEKVKGNLDAARIAWLIEWSSEIASQAQRNCKMDGDTGVQLRGSYEKIVNAEGTIAYIGTRLESGWWEEFGTGSHAVDRSKSRPGWWVYTPDNPGPTGYKSNYYVDEAEAKAMAGYIEEKYGHKAVATNGREPQHTLENAYKMVWPKAKADLPNEINEKLEGGST